MKRFGRYLTKDLKQSKGRGYENPQKSANYHFQGCMALNFLDRTVLKTHAVRGVSAQKIQRPGLEAGRTAYPHCVPHHYHGDEKTDDKHVGTQAFLKTHSRRHGADHRGMA